MEYAIAATACIFFALGAFAGHASGYARRGYVEHLRRMAAINGGPRYSRNARSYRVNAPSGLFIETPSKEAADAFAVKHGGSVVTPE